MCVCVCVCVYACMYVSVHTVYAYMRVGYVSTYSQGKVANCPRHEGIKGE
jgi:hypothetical protein